MARNRRISLESKSTSSFRRRDNSVSRAGENDLAPRGERETPRETRTIRENHRKKT